jgi:hypothetical protein
MHHQFERGNFGKCGVQINAVRICNLGRDATVHRYYRCRYGYCTHMEESIEARDRHEANEHGSGW